jgi:hypothetical protein
MIRVLSIAILLTLGPVPASPTGGGSAPPSLLGDVRTDLAAGLQDMNRAAEAAARAVELATGGEAEVRQILELVATHDPSVVDCGWVDPQGVLRWIEPAPWRDHEGVDLSGETIVREVQRSRQPVLGGIARSAEEIDAAELAYPVLTPAGRLAGTVRLLFRPGTLLARIVANRVEGTEWEIWILETDGRILYASDTASIGRSLVTDDRFQSSPELRELGRRMRTEAEGAAGTAVPVADRLDRRPREGWWTSVTLNGAAWRILLTRTSGGS